MTPATEFVLLELRLIKKLLSHVPSVSSFNRWNHLAYGVPGRHERAVHSAWRPKHLINRLLNVGIFQPVLGAAQGPAAPAESLSLPINHSAAVLTIIMFKCLVLQQSGGCGIVFASALHAAVSQPPVKNRVMSIKVQNITCLRRSDVLLFCYDWGRWGLEGPARFSEFHIWAAFLVTENVGSFKIKGQSGEKNRCFLVYRHSSWRGLDWIMVCLWLSAHWDGLFLRGSKGWGPEIATWLCLLPLWSG